MLEPTIRVGDELALGCLQDIIGKMEVMDVLSASNMYLNYLTSSKVEEIKSPNINLTCGFKNTLGFLNLSGLTTILENLIDDAIEAQKYVENKRFIKLSTIKKAGRVRLIIENSYDIKGIRIDNQKLTTGEEDEENHRIDFNRVCEAVKRENDTITRTVNHRIFTVEIVLPIES